MVDVQDWFDSFIDRQIKYRKLRPQFLIAVIAGIALSLDQGVLYYVFWATDAREFYGALIVMLMISYVMGPLLLWWIATSVFFLLGRIIGGHMNFGIVFRATGWGLIPLSGSCLSLGVGRFLALRESVEPCSHPEIICDPGMYNPFTARVDALFAYLATATSEPIFQIFYSIGAVLFLLTTYFWIKATEATSTLTRAGAIIVVGVPSLLILVIFTATVF